MQEDDLDELDDFIIDDEEGDSDDKEELRAAKLARKENKRKLVKNMGINYGISDEYDSMIPASNTTFSPLPSIQDLARD